MSTSSSPAMAIFFKRLQREHPKKIITIECDNLRPEAMRSKWRPRNSSLAVRGIHRHSSMPSIMKGATNGSATNYGKRSKSCRWEGGSSSTRMNSRWEPLDLQTNKPPSSPTGLESPICPERRKSLERPLRRISVDKIANFPDYQRALFSVQQRYSLDSTSSLEYEDDDEILDNEEIIIREIVPPRCPQRRASRQEFPIPSSPTLELPDYKSALQAVQQRYAAVSTSASSMAADSPTRPTRRDSIDEFGVRSVTV